MPRSSVRPPTASSPTPHPTRSRRPAKGLSRSISHHCALASIRRAARRSSKSNTKPCVCFRAEPVRRLPSRHSMASELICARGGHRADTVFADRAAETEYWIDLVRRRQHGTRIKGRVFKSVYDQWHDDADLIEVERAPEVAFDFDFKRRAIPVHDYDPRRVAGVRHATLVLARRIHASIATISSVGANRRSAL